MVIVAHPLELEYGHMVLHEYLIFYVELSISNGGSVSYEHDLLFGVLAEALRF